MNTEMNYRAPVVIGETYDIVLPWSEACMHMGLAGQLHAVRIAANGAYVDGGRGPHITWGEAGILEHDGRPTAMFSVWAGHNPAAA